MKLFGTFLGTAIALALLAGFLAGGYYLTIYVVSAFTVLEPQGRAIAAIVSVVVLLSAIIIAQAANRRGEEGAGASRAATYARVLSICCEPASPAERATVEVERSLALLGSAKVISAYARLRELATDGATPDDRAALLRTLILEMRRDLGRSDLTGAPADALLLLTEPRAAARTKAFT